jgi:hypothetical protein
MASDNEFMSKQTSVPAMRLPALAPRSKSGLYASLLVASLALGLGGCDYVGLQPVSKLEAKKEAEGRAIGGACRQAGRALEDCYTFNPQMPKAAIFLGWRDMNDYMMQNNLGVIKPEVAPVLPNGRARTDTPTSLPATAPTVPKPPAKAAALSAP